MSVFLQEKKDCKRLFGLFLGVAEHKKKIVKRLKLHAFFLFRESGKN